MLILVVEALAKAPDIGHLITWTVRIVTMQGVFYIKPEGEAFTMFFPSFSPKPLGWAIYHGTQVG